jgi:regulator of RNase E activity RraA
MLRLKLDGPASVAPGQRVRFSAIGDTADGATRDVADAVNWQRSASAFELGTSGDVVGRQIGESRLTASFPAPNLLAPLTDSVEVIVGPAGTVRVAAVWKNPPMPAPGRIGFRILPAPPRLDASVIDAFRGLASSNVADAMGRFNFMDPGMQARSGLPLCGLAVTVNARPGDNLMVHKALQLAGPGDIVVVSTNGNTTSAVFGELMCRTAVAREIGGLVVDGAIRDAEGITALGFPAFSRTVTPGGCDKDGPGEINVPVSCGGAVVHPGDIVVGDRDGIAVVPRADAADVLERVRALVGNEDRRVAEIESGQVFKADIDETLRKKGVIE